MTDTMQTYTMKDWQRDGVFSAKIGQIVDDAIYFEMLSCVPPAYRGHGIMQVGEPYSHDRITGRQLYATFADTENGYRFVGYCFLGKCDNCETIYL